MNHPTPTQISYYLSQMDVPHDNVIDRMFNVMKHQNVQAVSFYNDLSYDSHPAVPMPTNIAQEIFETQPHLFSISFFGDGSYHTMTLEEVGL